MLGIGYKIAGKETVCALVVRALVEIEYPIAKFDLRQLRVKNGFPVRQDSRL